MYMEYAECRKKYREALSLYEDILQEKEKLFARTQPKSVKYDQERVSGGTPSSVFDEYVVMLEKSRINERLAEAKDVLEERKNLMDHQEWMLRRSSDIVDRIFCMRILDRWRIRRISKATNYSEPQIYRILREIQDHLDDDRK